MNLPDINFATADADELDLEVCSAVESILGRKLARADPLRIFLRGIEQIILQQRLLIDQVAKQNLLAYAGGEYLEHIGALVGLTRKDAVAAKCTMRLTLTGARPVATVIPAGVRFCADDDNIWFALDEDQTFEIGAITLEASATCLETGTQGNGYIVGDINRIVDPKPYLQSAVNVTTSDGGSDIESDDEFRIRINTAPESFSVAGPRGAYAWFTKNVSPLITDVAVRCPTDADGNLRAGVVEVRPLLKGGELPGEEILAEISDALNADDVRPLTDKVEVRAPDVVEYQIDLQYRIARSDATRAAQIQRDVDAAVEGFVAWQKAELGRDLEPSELLYRLRQAGAKHIDLVFPEFTIVKSFEVAMPIFVQAAYLGLEDD